MGLVQRDTEYRGLRFSEVPWFRFWVAVRSGSARASLYVRPATRSLGESGDSP